MTDEQEPRDRFSDMTGWIMFPPDQAEEALALARKLRAEREERLRRYREAHPAPPTEADERSSAD